jgi:hypothetical protein
MMQRLPDQLAGAPMSVSKKFESLFCEGLHGGPRRTGPAKSFTKMPQRSLQLLIGVQDYALRRIIDQTDLERHLQFAALGLAQDTAAQTSLQHMQFGFAHCAFETKQKPVVKNEPGS